MTSVCLIVFAAILDINGKKLKLYDLAILLITILLLINTTGLIIFILYLILRNYFFKNSFFNSSYRAIINFPFFNVLFFRCESCEKFSYEYIKMVFHLKTVGIKDLLSSTNYLNLLFGSNIYFGFTDDFFQI